MGNKKKQTGTVVAYRWIGSGKSVPGVPTRDLTVDEWDRWGQTVLDTEANTGKKFFEPIHEEKTEPQEPEEVI